MGTKATLREVIKEWTVKDLMDAHELMDIEQAARKYAFDHPEGEEKP